jgi:two-component system NarL family sensor kinase
MMHGCSKAEGVGSTLRRYFPGSADIRGGAGIRLLTQARKAAPSETLCVVKDGRSSDASRAVAGADRDITELKKAGLELRRLHARVISAQETERKRLARELHDGVVQILSGVKYSLESLTGKLDLSGAAAGEILKVDGLLDLAIAEIRRVSHNLMPSELVDLGLEQALRALCRGFKTRGGVSVTLRVGYVPADLAPDLALAYFRIAQEALNNIGKHSKATMVEVALFCSKGNEIVLSVSDNGIGFDLGAGRLPAGRGIGLGNMRERAESIGGVLKVYSTSGAGTALAVHAPLTDPDRGGARNGRAGP